MPGSRRIVVGGLARPVRHGLIEVVVIIVFFVVATALHGINSAGNDRPVS
jgi:hypothetical protein